jgi:hypothetical protein
VTQKIMVGIGCVLVVVLSGCSADSPAPYRQGWDWMKHHPDQISNLQACEVADTKFVGKPSAVDFLAGCMDAQDGRSYNPANG